MTMIFPMPYLTISSIVRLIVIMIVGHGGGHAEHQSLLQLQVMYVVHVLIAVAPLQAHPRPVSQQDSMSLNTQCGHAPPSLHSCSGCLDFHFALVHQW